ncbi:hypothetical protein GDO78_006938 [Eleutherodactylus coqui]|uniref:Uncharacterized protein n=1 Tax=Eleutherodactylus coqui TaxID=57060 RepID=A0A8J6FFT4_ELECQ|nr:hypothetical protein GDO78_006938 [Eleutherodactylus coqui]
MQCNIHVFDSGLFCGACSMLSHPVCVFGSTTMSCFPKSAIPNYVKMFKFQNIKYQVKCQEIKYLALSLDVMCVQCFGTYFIVLDVKCSSGIMLVRDCGTSAVLKLH